MCIEKYTEYEGKMNDIQLKELNLLKTIIGLFNEKEIDYFLIGGSLLGAIRHKGFIPWDDDIDVGIPRNYYIKMKEVLKESSDLVVQEFNSTENYPFQFIKVRESRDENEYRDYNSYSQGIFVDLFPLDFLGNTYLTAKFNVSIVAFINKLILIKFIDKTKNKKILFSKLLTVFIPKFLLLYLMKHYTRNINKKKYFGNMFGRYKKKEILLYDIFYDNNKIKLIEFEDMKVRIPINYHAYLTQIYGDYMTLPKIENRISNHTGI